jgi:hypothetical protein
VEARQCQEEVLVTAGERIPDLQPLILKQGQHRRAFRHRDEVAIRIKDQHHHLTVGQ